MSKSIKKRLATRKAPADITNTRFASPTDVALAQAPRYCIMSDDSGHEYFVPVGQDKDFEKWVSYSDYYIDDYGGPDFEENRIDGTFTFTDPRCE